jgi:hypothetical protein
MHWLRNVIEFAVWVHVALALGIAAMLVLGLLLT